MTVGELIQELQKYPADWPVQLDVSAPADEPWEGDRVVRSVDAVEIQRGYRAVAINAQWELAEEDAPLDNTPEMDESTSS